MWVLAGGRNELWPGSRPTSLLAQTQVFLLYKMHFYTVQNLGGHEQRQSQLKMGNTCLLNLVLDLQNPHRKNKSPMAQRSVPETQGSSLLSLPVAFLEFSSCLFSVDL